jgi:hypothetical protein
LSIVVGPLNAFAGRGGGGGDDGAGVTVAADDEGGSTSQWWVDAMADATSSGGALVGTLKFMKC